jgi:hypothetical protein
VELVVDELAFALASPLGPSSALPVVAVAFAGPPVVVLLVFDVADAPDPETEAVPVAVIGALTLVAPTDAVLPWVVPAVMLVAPLPAVALLVTDGVTVCVMAPVLPASVVAAVAALPAVAAPSEHPLPPLPLPVFAVVQVLPPLAVLLALGETVMLVFPVLLVLEELGETVIVLPLTSPLPLADGLLLTDELPPFVVLDVDDDPLEVAVPLPPEPLAAVDVAGAPAVVAPVVVADVAPSANAGAAIRMTNNAAVATPAIADARDARKRCLNVDVSSEFMTYPPFP